MLPGFAGANIHDDQLRHFIESGVRRSGELHETQNVQRVEFAREHIQVKLRMAVLPHEMSGVDERNLILVSSCKHDQIDRLVATIDKVDPIAREASNIRLGDEITVCQVVEYLGIHDRVAGQQIVIRRR